MNIGSMIMMKAAESRMRLEKARQAIKELQEHERITLLDELIVVEEQRATRGDPFYGKCDTYTKVFETAHPKPSDVTMTMEILKDLKMEEHPKVKRVSTANKKTKKPKK